MKDTLAKAIVNAVRDYSKQLSDKYLRSVSLGECSLDPHTGLLYVYSPLYVPNDGTLHRVIIHTHHDYPVAGHRRREATYELVSRNYWWPGMHKKIARYLANCYTCALIKPVKHAPYRLLKRLYVPVVRWNSILIDFITGLPESHISDKPANPETFGFTPCL